MKEKRILRRYGRKIILGSVFGILTLLVVSVVWRFLTDFRGDNPRVTILFVNSPMYIFSWNRVSKQGIVFSIPDDVVIDVAYNRGQYTLSALWKLSLIEKNPRLLADSLENTLAVSIDYVFWTGVSESDKDNKKEDTTKILSLFSPVSALVTLVTRTWNMDMDAYRFFVVAWDISHAPLGSITTKPLFVSVNTIQKIRSDGATMYYMDPTVVDNTIAQEFIVPSARSEKLRIQVVNTTDIPGVGSFVARLLNHYGLLVIGTGNESPPIDTCHIAYNSAAANSKTVRFIASLLSCQSNESEDTKTGDIVLRLGEKFAQKYRKDR